MENILFKILQMKQNQLYNYLCNYLKNKKYMIDEGMGYIYAEGDIPIMLVAHLDTVHQTIPYQIFHDQQERVVWSPQGIGGDDRAGVFAILKIIENYKPHILFLEDEEIGGVGAGLASKFMDRPDVKFMIQFDRRGSDDAVFYDCGNKEFQNYILSFGFKHEEGTFSDISILAPAWDIAAVNLSIGYYNEHTFKEFISLNELEYTVERVESILDDTNSEWYDYQEEYQIPWWIQKPEELFDDNEDREWWEEDFPIDDEEGEVIEN